MNEFEWYLNEVEKERNKEPNMYGSYNRSCNSSALNPKTMNNKDIQNKIKNVEEELKHLRKQLDQTNKWPESIEDVKDRNYTGWHTLSSHERGIAFSALGNLRELHLQTSPQLDIKKEGWCLEIEFGGSWITFRFKTPEARDYFKEQHKELIENVEGI